MTDPTRDDPRPPLPEGTRWMGRGSEAGEIQDDLGRAYVDEGGDFVMTDEGVCSISRPVPVILAVLQQAGALPPSVGDVVAELRRWCAWPEGFDGAHDKWDESDWSTPDKFADALERSEVLPRSHPEPAPPDTFAAPTGKQPCTHPPEAWVSNADGSGRMRCRDCGRWKERGGDWDVAPWRCEHCNMVTSQSRQDHKCCGPAAPADDTDCMAGVFYDGGPNPPEPCGQCPSCQSGDSKRAPTDVETDDREAARLAWRRIDRDSNPSADWVTAYDLGCERGRASTRPRADLETATPADVIVSLLPVNSITNVMPDRYLDAVREYIREHFDVSESQANAAMDRRWERRSPEPTEPVKRYELTAIQLDEFTHTVGEDEDEDGAWVRYEDHASALADLLPGAPEATEDDREAAVKLWEEYKRGGDSTPTLDPIGFIALGRVSTRSPDEARGLMAHPDDLRDSGWTVAVHNDYRQDGEPHTFWLLTKDGRAIKGEGRTDAEALNEVRAILAALGKDGSDGKQE